MTLNIPDQTGRTAIVTGGSSGIGRATAAALAAKGARVILAVRDQTRGRAAAAEIGGRAESRSLDLGSLASVREFARTVDGPVDYLINNAGAMTATLRHTADGFESQLGVNHLGHFALANLLLDRITRRVVTVSSANYRGAHIDLADLQWQRRPYRPFGAYGQSKLANLLFTRELQRRLTGAGSAVLATAAHPGWAATGFTMATGRRLLDRTLALGTRLLAQGPDGGARPTLLATVGDVPGAGFCGPSRFGVRGPAVLEELSGAALDDDTARKLWEVSERLTGVRFSLATA
ncbi:oxidoreductase [Actinoplanes auranticolor]|uniref:Short-chain dehydrogenase n=1 Tax=Actinoplanes auranticolor TaxID=47988 RepID=A0A919SGT7_9ACTN|nr:oxidoreductase [Actinoplanes auranticolor]GIM71389.1 short-chain dehydrogenase [Actinoplanes auranticolor]